MTSTPRKKRSPAQYLGLVLRGMAMGASDIVPGVSGGTMAFILGIYEELIQSIRDVAGSRFVRAAVTFKLRDALALLNWPFLVAVASGILLSVFSLSRLLESLLENQPVFLWSFFFGLVLSSIWVVSRRVKKWRPGHVIALLAAAAAAYIVVGLVPAQTPNDPWFLFLSGAVAICAMVLPGISGAFILVLLGKYQYILAAVNDLDLLTLFFVAAGSAVGLVSFAQVLGWLLKRYHDLTVAALIGLMVGSLREIWPWKRDIDWLREAGGSFVLDSAGERIVTLHENFLPTLAESGAGEIGAALLLALVGFGLILLLDRLALRQGEGSA